MDRSTKIPMDDCGLDINCGRDGTWLHFSSPAGKHASLNVDLMEKNGIIGSALREWCADRQKQAEKIRSDNVQANASDDPVIAYDPDTRVVTIDGFRFSRELFSSFTASPPGIRFRIIERKNGVVTVGQERDPLEFAAPAMLKALNEATDAVDAALGMVEPGGPENIPNWDWLREVRDKGRSLIADTQRAMP